MEGCELVELCSQALILDSSIIEERIDVGGASILVAQQGARLRPESSQCCIVTFHDLGINYLSNFQAFFNHSLMRPVAARMPIFHINAPGQEDGAEELPQCYDYPTMDQLADHVVTVCNYYGIKQAICLGVGVGANVMTRVAAKNPDLVDGLFIINPVPTAAGWMEWAYQKRNIMYLNGTGISLSQVGDIGVNYRKTDYPQCVVDHLIWHHFGQPSEERSHDLMNVFKSYFSSFRIKPRNLAAFMESYLKRDDIGVTRDGPLTVDCHSLILCGNDSPYLESSIDMNQRLRPERTTWMKLFDCGLPLDEQPEKVAEAFILFVQGLGLGLLTCYKYKLQSKV